MLRTIAIAAFVVSSAAAVTGAMLFLAYGISDAPPERVTVAGMSDSAFVAAYENGTASIRARSREDAYAALGFLHGAEHGWTMTLWQRTARGQLSPWLGDSLLPLDRLTRRLGLAALAEDAYRSLPDEDKAVLDAYARGANSALLDPGLGRGHEFSVLETSPDRWEPWYALAVNRLVAWLATTPPPSDSLRDAPETLRAFYDSDRRLREWLHVYGFEASMAWTMQDSSGTTLLQEHVLGASALPVFQEVELSVLGEEPIAGATLIGTPFMPAGRSGTHAWAVLFSSSADLVRTTRDTARASYAYEKLEAADGQEYVLRIPRAQGELFFEADTPLRGPAAADSLGAIPVEPDTARTQAAPSSRTPGGAAATDTIGAGVPSMAPGWVLQWPGLRPVSDAPAWLGLRNETGAAFQIFGGDGLAMSRTGVARVLGTPLFAAEHARGIAVGNSEWSRYAVARLDSLAASPRPVGASATLSDVHSTWAAALAPPMIDAAVAVPDQPALVTEALAYLRNWDFGYDRASIAASIFDTWTRTYRDSLGHLPEPEVPDSALGINLLRYEVLERAVAELAAKFGQNPSQWRWEEVQPHRYHFPVWSADSLLAIDTGHLSRTRYASIVVPGAGHVSALSHGPSEIERGVTGPDRWDGWTSTQTWDAFHFRTRRFPANRFFGRYLVSDRAPEPHDVADPPEARYTTTLLPE